MTAVPADGRVGPYAVVAWWRLTIVAVAAGALRRLFAVVRNEPTPNALGYVDRAREFTFLDP